MRGSSGALDSTPVARPVRPPRREQAEQVSPYEAGLRPQPGLPNRPPYRPSWQDQPEPVGNMYQPQQMQDMRRQQMFPPMMQPFPQQQNSDSNRFIVFSFVLLLIVMAVIAIFLFLLPYL